MPSHDQAALLDLIGGFPPDPLRLVLEATAKRMANMPEGEALRPMLGADLARLKLLISALPDLQARKIRKFMIEVAAQVACDSVALMPAHLLADEPAPEPAREVVHVSVAKPAAEPEQRETETARLRRLDVRKAKESARVARLSPSGRYKRLAPAPAPPTPKAAPPKAPEPRAASSQGLHATGFVERWTATMRNVPPQRALAGVGLVLATLVALWMIPFRDIALMFFGESHPEWFF